MNQEKIQRTIKLFSHRLEEAEKEAKETSKSPASMFYSGKAKAYEFCVDYLVANSPGEKITAEVIEKIDKQIKENNAEATAMFKVSNRAGKKAGLEADAKLKKLFRDLSVNPTEYAYQKLEEKESSKVKRARDLKLGDIIDNGCCGKSLGVVLIAMRMNSWEGKEYYITLHLFPKKQQYITWWMDAEGETTAPHYFKNFHEAVKDYEERG